MTRQYKIVDDDLKVWVVYDKYGSFLDGVYLEKPEGVDSWWNVDEVEIKDKRPPEQQY